MPIFDWRDVRGTNLQERFPEWALGAESLRRQRPDQLSPATLMEARRDRTTRPSRPVVFVSHRQVDLDPAARIAYLACQAGFDYWLDVLDPSLGTGQSVPATANAIAMSIEMGLLNSSHVIIVMTPNTKGSQWVPYEYGRVKEPVPVTPKAAAWIAPALLGSALPEYLYLGMLMYSEAEIVAWFRAERAKHAGVASPCNWTKPVPRQL